MLNTFKDINTTLSKNISLGVKVKVVWQNAETGETEIIMKEFPEALAMAFSQDLTSRHVKPHGKALLVTGSTPDAYTAIFEWMLLCSKAKKVVFFPKFPNYIFYRATRVAVAAEILGLGELLDSMDKRMNAIAKGQVQTDCVWMLYTDLGCESKYKDMAAESIAQALHENRYRGYGHLRRFMREAPHFGDDVAYYERCLKEEEAASVSK